MSHPPEPPSRPKRPFPEAIAFGRAIASLRAGRKQEEVAEIGGIDPGSWSLFETGRRRPKQANIEKIARGLGCSRLELEELTWQFRRQQLDQQTSAAPTPAAPSPASEPSALALPWHAHPDPPPRPEPAELHPQVPEVLDLLAPVLDWFLRHLSRGDE
jgi:transcriptional regulator with XRE-family HTH domain